MLVHVDEHDEYFILLTALTLLDYDSAAVPFVIQILQTVWTQILGRTECWS